MTDDDRMDRARRIREMREGNRAENAGDESGEKAGDESGEKADDASGKDVDDGAAGNADDASTGDPAAATGGPPVESDDGDGGATIHVPSAELEDADVDIEEMARQAGVAAATGASAETADESEGDTGVGTDAGTGPGTLAAGAASADAAESGEHTRVLEFTLGAERYCLAIEYVEEIVKRETVTRVPNTPGCVEGVVDLRGQITTILDPKVLLDIDADGSEDLIVVFDPERFEDQGAIGWVVDDVDRVVPVAEQEVNTPPVDQEHIEGVIDRDGEFVIWTDPELDVEELAG